MDKRSLHHWLVRLKPFKTWYFWAAFVVMAAICVFALRANYSHMTTLREAVRVADKQNGDVEQALQELRAFVSGHMNTDLKRSNASVYPPIQLEGTYARLKQAEQDRVAAVNSKVYSDAQAHCERLYPGSFSGGPRVPCIEEYVKAHGTQVKKIPDALYKFDFVSPKLSFDLAGWAYMLSALLLLLAIFRTLLGSLLKRLSR